MGKTVPLVLSPREAGTIAFRASFGPAFGDGDRTSSLGSGVHGGRFPAAVVTGSTDSASAGGGTSAGRAVAAFQRIGYVQIDTISVIERAHHHVLWSRDRDYRPPILPALEAEPRQIFEYWAHAAAYLPLSDYRYCLPRMRRIAAQGHDWFPTDYRVVDWVRDRIHAEGPLRSQDFESEGARGPWWDWKPAKAALEFLFQSGELMVAARPGFQKLYDLTERVLPAGLDTSYPSEEEMGDWYVLRAVAALGVFTLRDLAYQRKEAKAGITRAVERACESGSLQPCAVQSPIGGPDCQALGTGKTGRSGPIDQPGGREQTVESWCDSGLLSRYPGLGTSGFGDGDSGGGDGRPVRILSPFDNLIIDRKRARRVFGLDYTMECYVPAAKRRFGYFALPVFHRGWPVGLIDCKADRKNRVLLVNRVGFDWGTGPEGGPDGFAGEFAAELASFTAFNGCASARS